MSNEEFGQTSSESGVAAAPPSYQATQAVSPRPSPTPNTNIVLATLQASVAGIVKLGQDTKKVSAIVAELDAFEKSLLTVPQPPIPGEDKCKSPDPLIAPFCAALDLATATATNVFETAESAAASEYSTAVGAWNLAIVTYNSSLKTANAALQVAVKAAKDTYNLKFNQDSQSRNQFLYYSMEAEIDAALTAYQSVSASAGNTLAAAAGTLIAAFATYATTAANLESVRLGAVATAQETFWQSVESARDQV